jgi:hypothetical protein
MRLFDSAVAVLFSKLTLGCSVGGGQLEVLLVGLVTPGHEEAIKRVTTLVSVNSAWEQSPNPSTAPSSVSQLPARPNESVPTRE